MKVYGTDLCIDCRNYRKIQKDRGFEAEYIDITGDIASLKEFLKIRDSDPLFDPVKEGGGVGIPFFVHEDGRKTLDMEEALGWMKLYTEP